MFVCDTPFDYSDNIYLVCPTWFINVSSKQALFGLSSAGTYHMHRVSNTSRSLED